nr:hypothetical protein [Leisingera daeponensis]
MDWRKRLGEARVVVSRIAPRVKQATFGNNPRVRSGLPFGSPNEDLVVAAYLDIAPFHEDIELLRASIQKVIKIEMVSMKLKYPSRHALLPQ